MNDPQLTEELREALRWRQACDTKLTALLLIDPIERAANFDQEITQAVHSVHQAHRREEAILWQLHPEARPDAVELHLEDRLNQLDDELAKAERFWEGVPLSVGPGQPLPVLNGDELATAPDPDVNPLHRLRTTTLIELERRRAPRLEKYFALRESYQRAPEAFER